MSGLRPSPAVARRARGGVGWAEPGETHKHASDTRVNVNHGAGSRLLLRDGPSGGQPAGSSDCSRTDAGVSVGRLRAGFQEMAAGAGEAAALQAPSALLCPRRGQPLLSEGEDRAGDAPRGTSFWLRPSPSSKPWSLLSNPEPGAGALGAAVGSPHSLFVLSFVGPGPRPSEPAESPHRPVLSPPRSSRRVIEGRVEVGLSSGAAPAAGATTPGTTMPPGSRCPHPGPPPGATPPPLGPRCPPGAGLNSWQKPRCAVAPCREQW